MLGAIAFRRKKYYKLLFCPNPFFDLSTNGNDWQAPVRLAVTLRARTCTKARQLCAQRVPMGTIRVMVLQQKGYNQCQMFSFNAFEAEGYA